MATYNKLVHPESRSLQHVAPEQSHQPLKNTRFYSAYVCKNFTASVRVSPHHVCEVSALSVHRLSCNSSKQEKPRPRLKKVKG